MWHRLCERFTCGVALATAPSPETVSPNFRTKEDGKGQGLALAWENVMKLLTRKVHRFLISEDGLAAIEYAVMLALIIVVCLVAISSIGSSANETFTDVVDGTYHGFDVR